MGRKRAAAIAQCSRSHLALVCDVDEAAARDMAQASGAEVSTWEEMVADKALDIVVVSTIHDGLAPISKAALEGG